MEYVGIYDDGFGKYNIARAIEFQDTTNLPFKYGGKLRSKPYFMIRLNEPDAIKTIEDSICLLNTHRNLSRDEALEKIRETIPNAIIYSSHDVGTRLGFEKNKDLANFIFK